MRDFTPAFCAECEVYVTLMADQNGDLALCCSCPDGARDLSDETAERVRPGVESGYGDQERVMEGDDAE